MNDGMWLRGLVCAAHDVARQEGERLEQRASDLATLADALELFYEHPSVGEEDKAELEGAVKRLLGGGT